MSDLVKLADLRIREAVPTDMGYVIDSWGRCLRGEYPDARTTDFVDAVRAGIKRRLDAGARVLVAHPADDPSLLLGWLASATGVLSYVHFVYVREPYRRGGIARALLGRELCVSTDFMTDAAREIRRAHPDKIRYLPTI